MREFTVDRDIESRLGDFLDQIGGLLNNKCRRASFATYAVGLLSDGDRKSMEPIAARATGTDQRVGAEHQRLQHFITDSPWDDRLVRRHAARYVTDALQERETIDTWIVDDTGFLKQGKHSVGVQRQYTGSAGKITNCQVGVSLTLATATRQAPVDMELYLPRRWADDADRRREAKIPNDVVFRTKPQLAIAMIDRALEDHLPRGVVLADCGYGTSSDFRDQLRDRGLDYAVEVRDCIKVWRTDAQGRRRGEPTTLANVADGLGPRCYRKLTWREGTQQTLWARFAFVEVVPCEDDGFPPGKRERLWLVVEQPRPGTPDRTKYYLSTVPTDLRKQWLVRLLKQRWRTERVYQDLKGQLGLDHFEGRRHRGWHHHVSVALCCYAFTAAEHARAFPPSASWSMEDAAHAIAA